MLTCTWAPTATTGLDLTGSGRRGRLGERAGTDLASRLLSPVHRAEELGIDQLLVAQRWWGTGAEIEGSTYDCMAMTAWYAATTERIGLITAVHPGFFLPGPTAKWAATIDRLTDGRWSINVTSGWHLDEFAMFGVDQPGHDRRYDRSREFIDVMRAAWSGGPVDHDGEFYRVEGLRVDPPPVSAGLTVFQGGQSDAARTMAATHSDWMFLNGGPPGKLAEIIQDVRGRAAAAGRTVRFAVYAIPLCRRTDAEADDEINRMVAAVDPDVAAARRNRVGGAEGMWAPGDDALSMLDSNEGYATRLIGSPDTIAERITELRSIGVDMLHLALGDPLFEDAVLPGVGGL
ncbi:MAG: LLM class flavin-dependent oxidoreductase [Actinomycetota bacterium]